MCYNEHREGTVTLKCHIMVSFNTSTITYLSVPMGAKFYFSYVAQNLKFKYIFIEHLNRGNWET